MSSLKLLWPQGLSQYQHVAVDEESSHQNKEIEKSGEDEKPCKHFCLTLCNVAVFVVSIMLFWSSYERQYGNATDGNSIIKAARSYSPLLDRIDISVSSSRVNASIGSVLESIYMQPPSPEVDAAWKRIGSLDPVTVTADEVRALGKDPSTAVKFPESLGFGPEAFVAGPNVMHQIHCLDKIRRDIEFDHYYGSEYKDGKRPAEHALHTNHCLYIILQQLMCNPSTEMYVFDWIEGQEAPFPDFGVKQQCLDTEAIVRWQQDSSVPRANMLGFTAPPGQTRISLSEDFKKIYEVTGKRPPTADDQ